MFEWETSGINHWFYKAVHWGRSDELPCWSVVQVNWSAKYLYL